jgi:hypothetical protein
VAYGTGGALYVGEVVESSFPYNLVRRLDDGRLRTVFGKDAPTLTGQAGKSLVAQAYATPDGAHDSGTFIAGPLPLIAAGGDTLLVTDTRIVFERRDDGTVRQILTSSEGTPLAPPLRPWGELGHARDHTATVDIQGAASLVAGPDGTPFVLARREKAPVPSHFTWQGTGEARSLSQDPSTEVLTVRRDGTVAAAALGAIGLTASKGWLYLATARSGGVIVVRTKILSA